MLRAPDGPLVAAIADGHFGATAAELAVQAPLEAAGGAGPPSGWLERALRDASARLDRSGSDAETAVIGVVAGSGGLDWVAIGDCRSYLLTDPPPRMSSLTPVGERYLGRRVGWPPVERGQLAVAGGRLLLATDGLLQCGPRQLAEEDIRAIALRGTPPKAARALVQAALDRGGEDNVTVVVGDL